MIDDQWVVYAVCPETDPELFFPDIGQNAHTAKAICSGCPVIAECLQWALEHGEVGVWGGTSDAERRRMTRPKKARTWDPSKRECPVCGNMFHPQRPDAKYCSTTCSGRRSTVTVTCKQCGTVFEGKRWENRKFCSRHCSGLWSRQHAGAAA